MWRRISAWSADVRVPRVPLQEEGGHVEQPRFLRLAVRTKVSCSSLIRSAPRRVDAPLVHRRAPLEGALAHCSAIHISVNWLTCGGRSCTYTLRPPAVRAEQPGR